MRPYPLAACVLLAACAPEEVAEPHGDAVPPSVAPEGAASDTAPDADVDRLRALGYADYAEETVDPTRAVVPILDPERSSPGYNLFSNRDLCSAQLIDARGEVLRTWSARDWFWSNVELVETPEGADLLVVGARFVDGVSGEAEDFVLRMAWDGGERWRRSIGAHHDVERLADGRIAVLTQTNRRIPWVNRDIDVADNGIAVLDADGEVLERYSLYEMLSINPFAFRFQPVKPMTFRGQVVIDLLHANSVEFVGPALARHVPELAEADVLVSFRHQDCMALFDLEKERVLWSWGQGKVSGPHDATLLESGHILFFDNGLGRGWSRVVEVDPATDEVVWEFRAPRQTDFFTASRGSAQRLPNGNTLIANSDSGEAFEVTPAGELVWRFLNPNAGEGGRRATIIRMKRYPAEWIEGLPAD